MENFDIVFDTFLLLLSAFVGAMLSSYARKHKEAREDQKDKYRDDKSRYNKDLEWLVNQSKEHEQKITELEKIFERLDERSAWITDILKQIKAKL